MVSERSWLLLLLNIFICVCVKSEIFIPKFMKYILKIKNERKERREWKGSIMLELYP